MKKSISSKKIDDSYLYPVYGHQKTKKVKQNTNKETYIYTDKNLLKDHYKNQYLTFEALEDGRFSFKYNEENYTYDPSLYNIYDIYKLYYSIDNGKSWNLLNNEEYTPTIKKGEKVLWKGLIILDLVNNPIGQFKSTNKYNIYGNIMSLIYEDNFQDKIEFPNTDLCEVRIIYGGLFSDTKVVNVNNLILPATVLTIGCYESMFKNCTLLKNASFILPAKILISKCYMNMFRGCTSLVNTPKLFATILANNCYSFMFEGCSSLMIAPELLSIDIESIDECYSYMFFNCIKLKYIKCLAQLENNYNISNIIPSSLYNWLYHVSTNGTFIKKRGVEFPIGSSGIPQGWTVIEVD